MDDIDTLEDDFRRGLLARLGQAGVEAGRTDIVYAEYLQDYEIIIDQTDLTDAQLSDVALAAWGLGVVLFKDMATYSRYAAIEGPIMLSIQAGGLLTDDEGHTRPERRPAEQALSDYVFALNHWCGGAPGRFFSLQPDGVVVCGSRMGLAASQAQRTLSAGVALVQTPGVRLRYPHPAG